MRRDRRHRSIWFPKHCSRAWKSGGTEGIGVFGSLNIAVGRSGVLENSGVCLFSDTEEIVMRS